MDTKRKEMVDKLLEEIGNAKNYTERDAAVRAFSMFVDALKNSPIVMKRTGSMPDGSILMYLKIDDENIVYATNSIDMDHISESIDRAADKLFKAACDLEVV